MRMPAPYALVPIGHDGAMPRLFVCVWPPADVVDLLEQLPRPAVDGVRWVAPATWHVTLRFVGDADVDEITARLGRAALPTATLTFGPALDLLSDRHLVVPVAGAEALALAVRSVTAGIGERDPYRFRGHLTLARADRGAADRLTGTPITARFEVREVALVASDLQADGPVYSTLAVFDTV
jgi:2'-5' RNA ligase